MNTPVNFELAKLLKEKGYDIPSLKCYLEDSSVQISSGDEGDFEEYNHNQWDNYSAPTISEVVMWLYEKHNIWIYSFRHDFDKEFYWSIDTKNEDEFTSDDVFNSPTEAYEAAITYTLTKLI